MKASRDQLKEIVREILIELLQEAAGNGLQQVRSPAPGRMPISGVQSEGTRLASGRRKPAFDPRLDTPVAGGRMATDSLKETIKREAGGNPIMAAILADTAATTLPSQLANGDRMGQPAEGTGMSMAAMGGGLPGGGREQFDGDPTEVFGMGGQLREDGSSHWADLAFAPGPGKKPL